MRIDYYYDCYGIFLGMHDKVTKQLMNRAALEGELLIRIFV